MARLKTRIVLEYFARIERFTTNHSDLWKPIALKKMGRRTRTRLAHRLI